MQPFDHYSPDSLPEALALMTQTKGEIHVIAGGSDLLLKMRDGGLRPAALINIKRLPELKGLTYHESNGLRIGALTTLRELNRSPAVQAHYPVLAETASLMASEQIRCFATVGGNLCNAAPSADLAPPLIALGGVAHLVGPSGKRQISLEEFFLGPGETALRPDELFLEVRIKPPRGKTLYLKHSQRAFMDIALVGVAARFIHEAGICQELSLVLGAVAPTPFGARRTEEVLIGQTLTRDVIDHAAQLAVEESSPIDDMRCSAEYRRRMLQVLVRRILEHIARSGVTA